MRVYLVIRELSDNDLGRQTKVISAHKGIDKANDVKAKWLNFFNEPDRLKALKVLNATARIYVEGIVLED